MLWVLAFIGFVVLLPSLLVLLALGLVVMAVPIAVLFSVGVVFAFFFCLLVWPGVFFFHILIAFALGLVVAHLFLSRPPRRA
jgi:hypothetical protein